MFPRHTTFAAIGLPCAILSRYAHESCYLRETQNGHMVTIHRANGATVEQHFRLEEGAVLLAPDMQGYFPDAGMVMRYAR